MTFQYENVQVDVVSVNNAFRCSKNRIKHLFSKIMENIYSSGNADLISVVCSGPISLKNFQTLEVFQRKTNIHSSVCLDWPNLRFWGLVYCLK